MSAVFLNDLGVVCPLGSGAQAVLANLLAGDRSGLVMDEQLRPGRPCPVGRVRDALVNVPAELALFDSRNARLLLTAAAQIGDSVEALKQRYGAARIGIVLGTSTSGIHRGEEALRALAQKGALPADFHYRQQALDSCAPLLARALGVSGPAWTLSTACSSSANALLSARRMMALGLADAVIAGGADSLCALTVQGFSALEAVSDAPCNPFSVHRDGINIGEAAALFTVTREPGPIALLGGAASSDAHHISAPEPHGRGAIVAIEAALADAGVAPDAVDYLNLHGTATRQNDAMESRAVQAVFGGRGPAASSTKALTGHTLGAAGALEAAFCWLLLSAGNPDQVLAPHCWDGHVDPELPALDLVEPGRCSARLDVCLSNSFAFGGNNVALVVGRA